MQVTEGTRKKVIQLQQTGFAEYHIYKRTGAADIITAASLVTPYMIMPENFYADLIIALVTAVLIIAVFNYYISAAKGELFKVRFIEMAGLSFSVSLFSFIMSYFIHQRLGNEI